MGRLNLQEVYYVRTTAMMQGAAHKNRYQCISPFCGKYEARKQNNKRETTFLPYCENKNILQTAHQVYSELNQ